MAHTVQSLALARAAAILGGTVALHDYLRVPSRDLTRWMSGEEQPPVLVFLRVVDLLDDHADKAVLGPGRPAWRQQSSGRAAGITTFD